jgi:hypothetical protein
MKRASVVALMLGLLPLMAYAQDYKISQIVFTTSTRGFSKQIVIGSGQIKVTEENSRSGKNPQNQSLDLPKKAWKELCKKLENVSLTEISRMESPTMKRASDAARTSTLTVKTKNGKIVSHDFDNENPNAKLQPLMEEILKLAKTEKGR